MEILQHLLGRHGRLRPIIPYTLYCSALQVIALFASVIFNTCQGLPRPKSPSKPRQVSSVHGDVHAR